jgi:hypothetical protein
MAMPIKRYVETAAVFTPQALAAMRKALTETVDILGLGSDEKKRETVARFIVRLAHEDGSLDAMTLRERAVAALGGVAYCDVHAIPRSSKSSRIAR